MSKSGGNYHLEIIAVPTTPYLLHMCERNGIPDILDAYGGYNWYSNKRSPITFGCVEIISAGNPFLPYSYFRPLFNSANIWAAFNANTFRLHHLSISCNVYSEWHKYMVIQRFRTFGHYACTLCLLCAVHKIRLEIFLRYIETETWTSSKWRPRLKCTDTLASPKLRPRPIRDALETV